MAKEEYFRMKIDGKEVHIKALSASGKLVILDKDGWVVASFYLNEKSSQKLLDLIHKYNLFYGEANM